MGLRRACRVAATIASTINTPILLGGRAVAIWAWFLGSFGCIAIAVSVAGNKSSYNFER